MGPDDEAKYVSKVHNRAIVAAFLAGCAVNPVTGKTEFMTVSTEAEIQMGQQNYAPMQQSQGGLATISTRR